MQAARSPVRVAAATAVAAFNSAGIHARADYVRHVVRVYVTSSRPGGRIACDAETIDIDHSGTVSAADVNALLGQ